MYARVLNRRVEFRIETPAFRALVAANFEAMLEARPDEDPDFIYSEIHTEFNSSILQACSEERFLEGDSPADKLWSLEKDLTVALQKARPELLFLHSAALVFRDRAFLFVASSGTGKSTTAFALLHHGFRYMSDELCPLDPQTLDVYPYPHALCVKRAPALPYTLPQQTIDLGRTLHVPTRHLDTEIATRPHTLAAIFMLERADDHGGPQSMRLRKAEAAARLYTNALNPLAHPNLGLDVAVAIVERVPCFHLSLSGLASTCSLIQREIDSLETRPRVVAA